MACPFGHPYTAPLTLPEGLDPAARLHQLSTFMGHVDPSSTAVYLTITPALLQEANQRFERFAEPAWTETQI